jgi:hypothetical protein
MSPHRRDRSERDQGTNFQFQFHECTDLRACVKRSGFGQLDPRAILSQEGRLEEDRLAAIVALSCVMRNPEATMRISCGIMCA